MIQYRTWLRDCVEFGLVGVRKDESSKFKRLYCFKYKDWCISSLCKEERKNYKQPKQLNLFNGN